MADQSSPTITRLLASGTPRSERRPGARGVGNQPQREETRRYLAETRPPVIPRAAISTAIADDREHYEAQVDRLDVVDLTILEVEMRLREQRRPYEFDWTPPW